MHPALTAYVLMLQDMSVNARTLTFIICWSVAAAFLAVSLWQTLIRGDKGFLKKMRSAPVVTNSSQEVGNTEASARAVTQSAVSSAAGSAAPVSTPVAHISEGGSLSFKDPPGAAESKPRLRTSAEILVKCAWKQGRKEFATGGSQAGGNDDCERAVQRGNAAGTHMVHVAVEYQIPQLQLMDQFVYGELGLVSRDELQGHSLQC